MWVTSSTAGEPIHPAFGHGKTVYNVIDVRQSYLQNVVRQGLLGLGYEDQVKHSIHFSYEMVALSPSCAEQLGITLSAEDRKRPHIEVSGRKGQGVKADDLLDRLESEARNEVRQRNPELADSEVREIAHQIAVGALRYFLLKFTRTAIIAFDFKEALNFDGETGPYLQYAAVRAGNILKEMSEIDEAFSVQNLSGYLAEAPMDGFSTKRTISGSSSIRLQGLMRLQLRRSRHWSPRQQPSTPLRSRSSSTSSITDTRSSRSRIRSEIVLPVGSGSRAARAGEDARDDGDPGAAKDVGRNVRIWRRSIVVISQLPNAAEVLKIELDYREQTWQVQLDDFENLNLRCRIRPISDFSRSSPP